LAGPRFGEEPRPVDPAYACKGMRGYGIKLAGFFLTHFWCSSIFLAII
jgi:hypothetical protein